MKFSKGKSGNPNGRPTGAKDKVNSLLRESIANFLEDNFIQLENDFKVLEPHQRIKLYSELLVYAVPKLAAESVSVKFEDLTDEQLDKIIEELKKSANEEKS